jgi:hypothetical protein
MQKGFYTLIRSGVLAGLVTIGLAGCEHHDKPHQYGNARKPVDEIENRGRGLQSKDVMEASDKMAMDLLADPALNASQTQWTVVVDHVENQTSDPRANLDIFIQRLRTNIFKEGRGRVQLIENRDKLHDLQNKELEPTGNSDQFGQGAGGHGGGGAAGIQPNYSLYAVMMDMPNRDTNYYFCRFTLTDLHNRTIAWEGSYEVKVRQPE